MDFDVSILTLLPDDELYYLLALCETEEILRLRHVLGNQRSSVFEQIERYLQAKHGMPALPLLLIHRLLPVEDEGERALTTLDSGDYPEYISLIYRRREDTWTIFDRAVENRREESALIIAKEEEDADLWYVLVSAMTYRLEVIFLYALNRIDFNEALSYALIWNMPFDDDDFLWALKLADPLLDEKLVRTLLAKTDGISSELMIEILSRLPDDQLLEARETHLRSIESGSSWLGGSYYYGNEITTLFDKELSRRIGR